MNEKEIIKSVITNEHTEFKPILDDIIKINKKVFSTIAKQVQEGEIIHVKNFGTFALKKRKIRRRYDQGLKKAVETEPKQIVEFTQSPNIFRDEKE